MLGFFVRNLMRLADLPRSSRKNIALTIDAVLCVSSVWLAFSLRIGAWAVSITPLLTVIAVVVPCWFVAAWFFGVYRSIIRSAGGRTIIDIGMACVVLALPMIAVFMIVGVHRVPRTVGMLQPMILLILLATSRVFIRYVLIGGRRIAAPGSRHRVAIYGAGKAGQQLALALRHEGHLDLVCYFDDDASFAGDRIDGIRIYATDDPGLVIGELAIDEILLAMPSVSRARRREIVEQIKRFPVRVRSLPSIGNIIDGEVSIRDLKDVRVEDLLGRDAVPPDEWLLDGTITGKRVLISGAGGSIGSELCRQALARNPSCLVLVEHSEFALYSILSELEDHAMRDEVEVVPELADVSDADAVRRIMERHRPQTVFHAAAYKHVPLVEANPISGLRNNILSTYNCCLEAERAGATRFILVSTDKAVRPTNIMGASKRVCELVLQGRASLKSTGTVFSIVRFGNVLSSSGSVVPRFQAQINNGGPITLTHREVTRYFMTIPEAAQLVMQAGAMAKGGEVFVLDMGAPVRIIDLARTMVRLSGCSVRDEDNPDGDIEIVEIGLRPGEKMYEELLIGDNPGPTSHPRIMRAQEKMLEWPDLSARLNEMRGALDRGDADTAKAILQDIVPDYAPASHDLRRNQTEEVLAGSQ